ncbi:hypothetical protein E5D57_004381 [Metarhizium anisopliae]|nr:hypothetical protein E5D57_004381 [Metarhizium anisopliae]
MASNVVQSLTKTHLFSLVRRRPKRVGVAKPANAEFGTAPVQMLAYYVVDPQVYFVRGEDYIAAREVLEFAR